MATWPTASDTSEGAEGSILGVDIGGSSLKVALLGPAGEPRGDTERVSTPRPATPAAIIDALATTRAARGGCARISVGFPGVVVGGCTRNAPNLGDDLWQDIALAALLEERLGRPARVVNDAELAGLGVITGLGVELVITLGTGFGSALFTGGRLVPNLELGQHPFAGGSYEDRLGDAALREIGEAAWKRLLEQAVALLRRTFYPRRLYLGGGNARLVDLDLPPEVCLASNADAMRGAARLWRVPLPT